MFVAILHVTLAVSSDLSLTVAAEFPAPRAERCRGELLRAFRQADSGHLSPQLQQPLP